MYSDFKGTLLNPPLYQGRWIVKNKETIFQISFHWTENLDDELSPEFE